MKRFNNKFWIFVIVISALYLFFKYFDFTPKRKDIQRIYSKSDISINNIKQIDYMLYNNFSFNFEQGYFINYSEKQRNDDPIYYSIFELNSGKKIKEDSICYQKFNRIESLENELLFCIGRSGQSYIYNLSTKTSEEISITNSYIFKGVLFSKYNKIIYLGEVEIDQEFVTGFFNYDYKKQEVKIIYVLEKNQQSKAKNNRLKYWGYFSPQERYIGYTFNMLPKIAIIESESFQWYNLIYSIDKTNPPVIGNYQDSYFYRSSIPSNQGFFISKINNKSNISLIPILNQYPNNKLILDSYNNKGQYINSFEIPLNNFNNSFIDYAISINNKIYLIGFNHILTINN